MAQFDVMLWNKDKTQSVRASKIRSFMIAHPPWETPLQKIFTVYGWYNDSESFHFGDFDTPSEANAFLTNIHKQIEGG